MKKQIKVFSFVLLLSSGLSATTNDLSKVYDMPDGSQILKKDVMVEPTTVIIPKSCHLDDLDGITRGKYIFHNLNSKKAKDKIPKGLAKVKKGEVKQYGNCVACHNIEGAIGAGNLGYDLTNYKATYQRDAQYVYQKISDPRIDNAQTRMTVNLPTKLLTKEEVCELTAYVMSSKEDKNNKKTNDKKLTIKKEK